MADGILHGYGLTQAELFEIRDAALEQLKAGGRVVSQVSAGSATGAGVQRSKGWALVQGMDAKYILSEVKYALHKLNPSAYPSGRHVASIRTRIV